MTAAIGSHCPKIETLKGFSGIPEKGALMVKLEMRGVFPAPREKVMKVLEMHFDDSLIGRIHPGVVQRTLAREGWHATFERDWPIRGRTWRARWRVDFVPPEKYRYEILDSEGPIDRGFCLENTYAEVPEGTLISSQGEISIQGAPRFLQAWFAKRVLTQIDREDLDYLRKAIP